MSLQKKPNILLVDDDKRTLETVADIWLKHAHIAVKKVHGHSNADHGRT